MAKAKYRYNPETLSFDKITTTVKEKITRWGILLAASIAISIGYFAIYSYIYDTPKERALAGKLAELKFNYQMLSQDLDHIDRILSDIQKRDDDIYRTVLESEPIPASIRQAGFGGINRYEPLEGYLNSSIMITASKHTDKIIKQLYIQTYSYDELIAKALSKEEMASHRPAILPVSNKDGRYTSSSYGMRLHPVLKYARMHAGMDFVAPTGTNIYATGDGKVIRAERSKGGYGNLVVIDHGFNYQTYYAHMHAIGVEEGDEVKRGQIIGAVGNTGLSSGPHLHYEVHIRGNHTNPINYFHNDLSPDEYVQMVEESQKNDILEPW